MSRKKLSFLVGSLGLTGSINAAQQNGFACGKPEQLGNEDLFSNLAARSGPSQPGSGPGARPMGMLFGKRRKKRSPGGNTPGGRIVGGEAAKENSWPWHLYMNFCGHWNNGYSTVLYCGSCGGSIISATWAVSAGHCVPTNSITQVKVYYGLHFSADTYNSDGSSNNLKITTNVIRHADYNEYSFDNDISLVNFDAIEFSGNVMPVCLPSQNTCFADGSACVVTGFGIESETDTTIADELREVAVRLMSDDDCKKFKHYNVLTDSMLCAGYKDGGKDACSGDSGGPLVCRIPNSNQWILQGIVSWGYGCARAEQPGVYTDVHHMREWIEDYSGVSASNAGDCNGSQCTSQGSCHQPQDAEWNAMHTGGFTQPELQGCSLADQYTGRSTAFGKSVSVSTNSVSLSSDEACTWSVTNTQSDAFVSLSIQNVQIACESTAVADNGDVFIITAQSTGIQYKICVQQGTVYMDPQGFDFNILTSHNAASRTIEIKYTINDLRNICGDQGTNVISSSSPKTVNTYNYPNNYAHNTNCKWHFKTHASEGQLTITVNSYHSESEIGCNKYNDNLIVVEADSCDDEDFANGQIIGALCGNIAQSTYTVYADSICIMHRADGDNNTNQGGSFTVSV